MRPATPPDASAGGRAGEGDRVTKLAILAFAALAAFFLIGPAFRATLWLEQPNEGWNAGHALRAFSGGLYPPRTSLFINNYPPLWFYLTGALGRWFGDPIFPGRAVAFASYFAVAGAIYALVRRLGIGAPAALIGALGFLVTMELHFASYVGLAEPQMLAHALATWAAAWAVGTKSRRMIFAPALLTVVALLVKPVVIGLPIAVTLWLILRRPALAVSWILAGASASLVAFGGLVAAYGPLFARNMTSPRYLTWERFGTNLALASRVVVPLIAFAVPAAILRRTWDDALAFAGLAIAAAFVPILLFGPALGVSINIGFDLVIAASIGLAVGWERAGAALGPRAGGWRAALALAFVAVALIAAPRGAFDPQALRQAKSTSDRLVALRDRLATLNGPVVCETLSVCVWAGKPSTADLWKLRHERTLAFLDPAPMLATIRSGGYTAVVTLGAVSSPRDEGHLPGLAAALASGYEPPVAYAGASLYLPKAAP